MTRINHIAAITIITVLLPGVGFASSNRSIYCPRFLHISSYCHDGQEGPLVWRYAISLESGIGGDGSRSGSSKSSTYKVQFPILNPVSENPGFSLPMTEVVLKRAIDPASYPGMSPVYDSKRLSIYLGPIGHNPRTVSPGDYPMGVGVHLNLKSR